MKRILSLILLSLPASKIAWTPDLLEFVKQGSLQKGKKIAESCMGCHGEKGISQIEDYPSWLVN